MSLEMQLYQIEGQDHYRPVVTCDHCLRPVQPARAGTAAWQVDERGAPIAGGALYFTHKDCWRAFEAAQVVMAGGSAKTSVPSCSFSVSG